MELDDRLRDREEVTLPVEQGEEVGAPLALRNDEREKFALGVGAHRDGVGVSVPEIVEHTELLGEGEDETDMEKLSEEVAEGQREGVSVALGLSLGRTVQLALPVVQGEPLAEGQGVAVPEALGQPLVVRDTVTLLETLVLRLLLTVTLTARVATAVGEGVTLVEAEPLAAMLREGVAELLGERDGERDCVGERVMERVTEALVQRVMVGEVVADSEEESVEDAQTDGVVEPLGPREVVIQELLVTESVPEPHEVGLAVAHCEGLRVGMVDVDCVRLPVKLGESVEQDVEEALGHLQDVGEGDTLNVVEMVEVVVWEGDTVGVLHGEEEGVEVVDWEPLRVMLPVAQGEALLEGEGDVDGVSEDETVVEGLTL